MASSVFLGSDGVGHLVDGRFPLLRWLGGIERGSVFLTEMESDPPRKAAIKLIPAPAVDADARLAQWAVARNLTHPHLMRLFHAGRCDVDGEDQLYAVTDYADEVLSEILAVRPLTPPETAEMLGPVLDALSWLHTRDLVHAHLKPSNIMVVDDCLKLSVDCLYSDGEFGSPALASGRYDAPEIATGIISPATDVWSLGLLMVEALTQHLPAWDGPRSGDPVVPATLPEPFLSLARACLQVDPERRCTLGRVRAALAPAHAAGSAGNSTIASPSRTRRMIVAGAGVLIVGGTIAALILDSHRSSPAPAVTQDSAPAPSVTEPQSPVAASPAPAPPAAKAPAPNPQPPAAKTPAAESPAPPSPKSEAPDPQSPESEAPPSPVRESPSPAAVSSSVVKAAVVSRTAPDVPQSVLNTIQGHVRVKIRVEVDPQGKVTDATIEDLGPSHYFAAKALASARNWTFTPAQLNGHPAASTWILHFSFGPSDTTITPEETRP